jgi:hypothetical protein
MLDENGHLVWPTNTYKMSPLSNAIYWFGTTYSYATLNDPMLATFMIVFHFLSQNTFEFLYPKSWPSMWCHFVNILVVVGILRGPLSLPSL